MKKVIYVGMYDIFHEGKKIRSYSLAAARKIDYITSVLQQKDYNVEILSAAYINVEGQGIIQGTTIDIEPNKHLVLATSWSASNKFLRIWRIICILWNIFIYLLFNTNKESKVIVYHNYFYTIPIIAAKLIRRFDLILEIEEQYAMIWKLSPWQKRKEDILLKAGRKKPLIVSEVLAKKMGIDDFIVSYGNYNSYSGEIKPKGKRKEIILIYTGSIDKTKGSAYHAIEVMKYLPDNYILFVSGYIEKGEEKIFEEKLSKVNNQCGRRACQYLGILDEKEYEELLLSADIALNLQKEGEFGAYLFPSKILTYLSYNINVVTTRGESIINSSVKDILYFADNYTYEAIAKAIKSVDFERGIDYRDRLKQLNNVFAQKISERLL